MTSFSGAWDALVQFQAAVKQAVPEALLQIEETETRLGISLVYPPQAAGAAAEPSPDAARAPRGRPPGSMLNETALAQLVASRPGITRVQILDEVRRAQPGVNAGTLSTRLSALVKKGVIRQEGEGYREIARAA